MSKFGELKALHESVKVAPESVLSNRGQSWRYALDRAGFAQGEVFARRVISGGELYPYTLLNIIFMLQASDLTPLCSVYTQRWSLPQVLSYYGFTNHASCLHQLHDHCVVVYSTTSRLRSVDHMILTRCSSVTDRNWKGQNTGGATRGAGREIPPPSTLYGKECPAGRFLPTVYCTLPYIAFFAKTIVDKMMSPSPYDGMAVTFSPCAAQINNEPIDFCCYRHSPAVFFVINLNVNISHQQIVTIHSNLRLWHSICLK